MKTKLGIDFIATEKFIGGLTMPTEDQQAKDKKNRILTTPKIVVCPPVEEMPDKTSKATRLLRIISRRLSPNTDSDSIGSSSSTDSMISKTSHPDDQSSGSSSNSSSKMSDRRRRHSSTVSLRKVFQSLNLTVRSQSCSPLERRKPKKQAQPKSILRPPVTYTYVKGLSGLPTQRVPRHVVYRNSSGLHR